MLRHNSDNTATAAAPHLEREDHTYLSFVDGLRAVSILAVVAFHVGLPGIPGGFVGVDIFFVISGFLIINQIRDGLERGRFSIFAFYARRVLRILPPFFAVVIVVFIAAPFILPAPTVYAEYGRQAAVAPVMLSNFLFYWRTGYFDLQANEKLFLHTWTLSVEEQFYLFAPIILMALFVLNGRRFGRLALAVAIAMALVSFAGAVAYTITVGRNAAFYFPHWRAWEFIAGGLICRELVAALSRVPRAVIEAMALLGLACILVAVLWLHSRMPFPSWRAAIPVAGAVLVILAGLVEPRNWVARLLSLRWMVFIGLVSYAWYLWHWPILSAMRILRLGDPDLLPDVLGAGVVGFIMACLSYRYLELPIRQWRRRNRDTIRPGAVVAAGVASSIALAVIGGITGYAGYRVNSNYVQSRYHIDGQGIVDNGCQLFITRTLNPRCLEGKFGVLIGDSHAHALSGSFTRIFQEKGIRLISLAHPGCFPTEFAPGRRNLRSICGFMMKPFEQIMERADQLEFVIFSTRWPFGADQERLSETLKQFPQHTRILMIQPVPMFRYQGLDCVIRSDRFDISRDRCVLSRKEVEAKTVPLSNVMAAAAVGKSNVRLFDPLKVFCDAQTCRPFDGDRVYYRDSHHVLPLGAEQIFQGFEKDHAWLVGRK